VKEKEECESLQTPVDLLSAFPSWQLEGKWGNEVGFWRREGEGDKVGRRKLALVEKFHHSQGKRKGSPFKEGEGLITGFPSHRQTREKVGEKRTKQNRPNRGEKFRSGDQNRKRSPGDFAPKEKRGGPAG